MSRTWEDNAVEFSALSKQGKDLRLALLAACSVERTKQGRPTADEKVQMHLSGKITATDFAAKAGTDKNRVVRHLDAWDRFATKAKLPLAARLKPDSAETLVPKNEDDSERWTKAWKDTSLLSATDDPTPGAQVTKVITQNHPALAAAIKNDPKTRAAAAQALVDAGALDTLSDATAKAAKNKQVERNRNRLAQGTGKATTVQGPKPTPLSPGVAAFMSNHGLADALRALVTTFPQEWEATSEEAKTEDYIGACEESLDKISIALSNCRNLVAGGVSDSDIERLLDQGAS